MQKLTPVAEHEASRQRRIQPHIQPAKPQARYPHRCRRSERCHGALCAPEIRAQGLCCSQAQESHSRWSQCQFGGRSAATSPSQACKEVRLLAWSSISLGHSTEIHSSAIACSDWLGWPFDPSCRKDEQAFARLWISCGKPRGGEFRHQTGLVEGDGLLRRTPQLDGAQKRQWQSGQGRRDSCASG